MRAAIVMGVLGLIASAIWLAATEDDRKALLHHFGNAQNASAPNAQNANAQNAKPVTAAKRAHDCRDVCEQNSIVDHWPDEELRACRARCGGEAAPRPYEPIRRITVAPVDHHREPLPP